MKRWFAALAAGALFCFPTLLRADTPSGHPTATELPFVKSISADLGARFATTAAAERAGYERYTNEDATGAISYANRVWTSVDEKHPSQLWYDINGRLLGADFSVLKTDKPPHLFGVEPSRWGTFPQHVHFGFKGPDGTTIYGGTSPKKIAAAGGDPLHPKAKDIVAAGIAKKPSDVLFTFPFPAIWDLAVWVIPNANGAFADKNPAVHRVHPPTYDDHM